MNHTDCREIYNCGSLKPFNEVTHHPCGHTLDITGRLEEGECHRKYPCSANSLENQASLLLSFVKLLSTAEFCSLIVQHLYILLLNEKEKKKKKCRSACIQQNISFHYSSGCITKVKGYCIVLRCIFKLSNHPALEFTDHMQGKKIWVHRSKHKCSFNTELLS